jgi:hypothetical protein
MPATLFTVSRAELFLTAEANVSYDRAFLNLILSDARMSVLSRKNT